MIQIGLAAPICACGMVSIAAKRLHKPVEVRKMAIIVPEERGEKIKEKERKERKERRGVEWREETW